MIPKIIHYCWFGGKELPASARSYIRTWREHMPGYEIREWNEKNFDVSAAPLYVRQAYEAGKFAFVSDYVRIRALLEHGGIYFDTDVEVVRPFEEYLEGRGLVSGFESERMLTTAFIACRPGLSLMEEFEKTYHERSFIREDGSLDLTEINVGFSRLAEKYGLDLSRNEFQEFGGDMAVYPIEIFAAFDVKNWHEKVTGNTRTIHHMDASWMDKKGKIHIALIRGLQRVLGYDAYDRLKARFRR